MKLIDKIEVYGTAMKLVGKYGNQYGDVDFANSILLECKEEADRLTELREQMKVINQMILEVTHAQDVGPDWYTRGDSGLRAQVRSWVERGHIAANKINEILK